MPDVSVVGEPPELDANGVVVISDDVRAHLARLGIVATEPAGSVKPCGSSSHRPTWYRRPWPMGDMSCNTCHPSIETLQAEGYPGARRNLVPQKTVGRYINKDRKKRDKATSDMADRVDTRDLLFGDDV